MHAGKDTTLCFSTQDSFCLKSHNCSLSPPNLIHVAPLISWPRCSKEVTKLYLIFAVLVTLIMGKAEVERGGTRGMLATPVRDEEDLNWILLRLLVRGVFSHCRALGQTLFLILNCLVLPFLVLPRAIDGQGDGSYQGSDDP